MLGRFWGRQQRRASWIPRIRAQRIALEHALDKRVTAELVAVAPEVSEDRLRLLAITARAFGARFAGFSRLDTRPTSTRVRVPAGTFDALRIEKFIRIQHQNEGRNDMVRRDTVWLAPETGRWVAREIKGEYKVIGTKTHDAYETSFRWELTAWI